MAPAYADGRLAAINKDLLRGGRKNDDRPAGIIEVIIQTTREYGLYWVIRLMIEFVGVNPMMVLRTWRAHGIKSLRVKILKVSYGPEFSVKLEHMVGLYLSAEHVVAPR